MKLDLHVIQGFGPNCLNRDDTGAVKDCMFGGTRRSRISSQCTKRACRLFIQEGGLVPAGNLSIRTRLLKERCAERLVEAGHGEEEAKQVADSALKTMLPKNKKDAKEDGEKEKKAKKDKKHDYTEYLIFIGNANVDRMVSLCEEHWDILTTGAVGEKDPVAEEFRAVLTENEAIDLALFGRMLADVPKGNVDAACQVAHAVSTNRTSVEYDYFTAVDDLLGNEETGAGHVDSAEFTDPCYYRYASLDIEQLKENLGGDEKLATIATEAFMRAFALAIPTGRQNSFAAHNPPSLVLAVLRDGMPWNLLNAFSAPVTARNGGLIENSVKKLLAYWDELAAVYGDQGTVVAPWISIGVDPGNGFSLAPSKAKDFEALVDTVVKSL